MASIQSALVRAVAASPFLALAYLCAKTMNAPQLIENEIVFRETGQIRWDGGVVDILPDFFPPPVQFLGEIWYGTTGTFSPSTMGYDPVAWWQFFTFLNDLGVIYAVFMLESSRSSSAWTPAYLATFFLSAAQVLGIGVVAPFYYFLLQVFTPSVSKLAQSPEQHKIATKYLTTFIPLLLALHTAEVFAMFLSTSMDTRHYWTYAWQASPLWLGIANYAASFVMPISLRKSTAASPGFVLAVTALVSTGTWVYMLTNSPYSLATTFIPDFSMFEEFVAHTRKAFQADEYFAFLASGLWIVYSFVEFWLTGIVTSADWLALVGLVPVTLAVGPGAAFAAGWYWREMKLDAGKK